MKRLLVCVAALAICAVDRKDATAQYGSGTDYQSILSQVQVPSFDQVGTYGPSGYNTAGPNYPSQGMPPGNAAGINPRGMNVGYRQQEVQGQLQAPPAPATQSGMSYDPYAGQGQVSGGKAPVVNGNHGGSGCGGGCGTVQGTAPRASAACSGNVYNSIYGGNGGNNWSAVNGYGGGAPVYSPGQSIANGVGSGCGAAGYVGSLSGEYSSNGLSNRNATQRNFFFGANGLIFDRDYEDDEFLTRNPAGDQLLSTDADSGTLGGLEFFFGSRNSCGNGWELRYWGLFADEASFSLAGASFTPYITGLQDLVWPNTGDTVYDVFSRGTVNTITRDNEFHNVEASMLRRGGCFTTRSGRCGSYEFLSGFRWLEFDEEFRWDVTGPTPPTGLFFNTEVDNTLLGFQLGGNSELCLTQRMRLNVGTKFGVFNNRIRANQVITNGMGSYATVNGTDYNYRDSKNDVSLLGELNLGSSFNLNQCSRLVVGYRAIGISGIALAPDQYNNFNFGPAIRSIQSNNDLILHGSFFGLEFCR